MMNSIFLIGVCVIMPIIVVWLNNRTSQNETNKKTEILLKSIESFQVRTFSTSLLILDRILRWEQVWDM